MSNVVQFPAPVSTQCSASTMPAMSMAEIRAAAWSNYYGAERDDGVSIELARSRADAFVAHRFDGLMTTITAIMKEG